jgi:hypothetical protein
MNTDPKSILTSKTAWWNVLTLLAQTLPSVSGIIPQPWGIIATALGNILLRIVTTQPVTVP